MQTDLRAIETGKVRVPMNLDRGWARVLFVLALGLAAISGLSVVLEALAMPRWVVTFAVLAAFVAVVGLALGAAVKRESTERRRADGFESA